MRRKTINRFACIVLALVILAASSSAFADGLTAGYEDDMAIARR